MNDLLLRDVRVVPLAPGETPGDPVDVLVEDGTVTAVGPGLARPEGVEEVAGEGRWLAPGLWDQHVHLGQWTLTRNRVDTSALGSPEEATALVGRHVHEHPGRPVIGWGHRPAGWHREVTVSELDEVSGVTPVVLVAGDGHHAWLNSAGLAALGLGARDDVVRETEWYPAYELLTRLTGDDELAPAAYRVTMEDAAARGIVGMVDFEFAGGVDAWAERWSAGADLQRVRVATYADRLEEVIELGHRTGQPLVPGVSDLIAMGPLKIISDGSLNTRTAWCCEPYADGGLPGQPSGAPNLAPHELQAQMARAHMSGLEIAVHAIGDAAVAAALDAFQATSSRGSIEHAQLMRRDDIGRLAALGVRASVQPAHLLDDRDLTEQIWPGRGGRAFAFRWMLEAGVRVVLGTYAPVSPLDRWLAMAAAVHRSADDRDPWHPEHALTPQEALAASTGEQPTVGVGSRGDLVLLDRDPLAVHDDERTTSEQLRTMPVALTVLAGRVTHRAL